jgi:recombination protein RecA
MTTRATAAADKFREKFAKTFGEGTIIRASERSPYEVIPTGSLTLDHALGVGGWVRGRLVEIWGDNAVGKTTLSLLSLAEAQRAYPDLEAGFIDMEQTFDRDHAERLGVDVERLFLVTPPSAEDVADSLKSMLTSELFSIIVVDSIGAMIPEKEKEKAADEATVAMQAKIVTRMVKIAATEAAACGTVVIFLNQVRANVGGYGAATTTPGGFALKHVTTHKVKLKRTGTTPYTVRRSGEAQQVGHEVAAVVERNKVAPPRRTATLNIFHTSSPEYGPVGIDKADEAVVIGERIDAIEKGGGGWYTVRFTGERIRGREELVKSLREQPEVVERIRAQAIAAVAHEVVLEGNENHDPEAADDDTPES